MKNRGFTLIELLVVVTIIAVLALALGFSFQGWIGGYKIESQTKDLYADMMAARISAMQTNTSHFVVVTSDADRGQYSVFEDANGNGAYDAGTENVMQKFTNPKILDYPLLCNGAECDDVVTFNPKGIASPNGTIHLDKGDNNPDYDCIVVFSTRINIGKWDDDDEECDAK
ncbi:MAG: GspH/FimT family pseudopilin [Nitrospirae bacterium]|nr:GspH/FimT family pseudopilin [Nitrospirota bacterium]